MQFSIIVAMSAEARGIGYKGAMPWNLPTDMRRFKEITTHTADASRQNAVIMGRKTRDSLPLGVLPNRINVVLSRTSHLSLTDALQMLSAESIFVIGGESVYREAIAMPECTKIYCTVVEETGLEFA